MWSGFSCGLACGWERRRAEVLRRSVKHSNINADRLQLQSLLGILVSVSTETRNDVAFDLRQEQRDIITYYRGAFFLCILGSNQCNRETASSSSVKQYREMQYDVLVARVQLPPI